MDSKRRGSGSLAIGEDHLALARAVESFVGDACPSDLVRGAIDAHNTGAPGFHDALAGLGWLGLHLPADQGGEGFGLSEATLIVEELGRAVAPGPLLTTFWAGSILAHALATANAEGGETPCATVGSQVKGLADGSLSASVVLGRPLLGEQGADGSVVVSGTTEPVLSGVEADLVVIPVELDGTESWWVAPRNAFNPAALEPLDPTRSTASLSFEGSELAADARLPGVDRDVVDGIVAVLSAAEAAGIASWCVDTASAYAADRRQFGRPIGQFQAVKHRCADMLVATEASRAVTWDAARALDSARSDPSELDAALLAARIAAAVTLDAAVRVAEDAIQVLGGIGFTWEHDAHLHLRRAVALRQILGGSGRHRRAVAHAALGGVRRALRVDLPGGAEALRAELRQTVDEVAVLEGGARRELLVATGLLVPHWPEPWGRNASAIEQLLIDEELARARVRRPHLQVGAWAAPTIVAHGTPDQQERWVRPTLLGTTTWCQLFSEPEAGSDLASLRTTATRTEGGWLIDGQKVWTTMATEADWGIALVRTNPDAPKHLGITYVIIDMRSDGIDVRPLREMTGLEMFNEVFLNKVFVPDDCVIGEVDGGWALARTTLGNERVAMGSGSSFGGGIEALLQSVSARRAGGGLGADRVVDDRIGALVAEAHAVAALGTRATLRSVAGAPPGPEASIRKLLGVEHDQRTQEAGLDLLGALGATVTGEGAQWTFGFLANRCLTIAGGTSEIQRNVIGERLLGLPRDPEPAT